MRVSNHRVRSYEVDSQGFVFNGRYLEYADAAMTEYFRALGWGYNELIAAGADPSVVQLGVTYRQPAKLDDLLSIQTGCSRLGNSSFELTVGIDRNDTRLADITLTYVNVDTVTGRSRPLPPAIAEAIRADLSS